jgi:hypothetical protein
MNPAGSQTPTPTTASEVLGAPGSSPGQGSSHQTSTPGAPNPNPAQAPNPAAPAKPEPDQKVSGKLQVLIQRERAASERERVAKAKEAEIAQREARLAEFEAARGNVDQALKYLGLSYEDITKAKLADGQLPPEVGIRKLEEKVEGVQKRIEEKLRAEEERRKQTEQRQLEQRMENFKGEISTYLEQNANRYEFIKFEGNEDLVFDVIEENYNRTLKAEIEKAAGLEADPERTLEQARQLAEESGVDISDLRGEVWTIAQAADKVELHLEQKYAKARELSKFKAMLAPQPALRVPKTQPKPADKPNPNQTRQTPKTLTNDMSASPARPTGILTDAERVAKAIAYAKSLRPNAG